MAKAADVEKCIRNVVGAIINAAYEIGQTGVVSQVVVTEIKVDGRMDIQTAEFLDLQVTTQAPVGSTVSVVSEEQTTETGNRTDESRRQIENSGSRERESVITQDE